MTIYVHPKSRYHPYCFRCYCVANPDTEIPRKYKLKEHHLREELRKEFPDTKLIFDKAVDGGCSKKRPDVRIECLTHTVIIECDENQHKGYNCETKRTMELFQDLGNRPLVMIRFNPDKYGENGGCFKNTKTGIVSLNKKEWNKRMIVLKEKIRESCERVPKKEITIESVFFK